MGAPVRSALVSVTITAIRHVLPGGKIVATRCLNAAPQVRITGVMSIYTELVDGKIKHCFFFSMAVQLSLGTPTAASDIMQTRT